MWTSLVVIPVSDLVPFGISGYWQMATQRTDESSAWGILRNSQAKTHAGETGCFGPVGILGQRGAWNRWKECHM